MDIRKEDYINSTAITAGVSDVYLLSYSSGTISSAVSDIAAIESTKNGSKYAVLQKTNPLFYSVAFTCTFTVG